MITLEERILGFFSHLQLSSPGHILLQSNSDFSQWLEDYRNGGRKYEKHLLGITQHKLSEAEALLILAYSGSASRWCNEHFRHSLSPDKDELRIKYHALLREVLDKLPAYNRQITYRLEINPLILDGDEGLYYEWLESKEGKTVYTPFFWSTTKKPWDDEVIVWEIETNNNSKGRDISTIANDPDEGEVLFMPDAAFEIKSVNRQKQTIKVVEVKERVNAVPLIGLYYKGY